MTTKQKNKLIHIYNNRGLYIWGAMCCAFCAVCFFTIFTLLALAISFAKPRAMFILVDLSKPFDIRTVAIFCGTMFILFSLVAFFLYNRVQNYIIVKFRFLRKDFKPHVY